MTEASEAVLHLWRALANRDWETVKTVVSDDCIFTDMPLGPTMAARGPDNIVKRLKTLFENEDLAGYANHDGVLLSNGVDVIYGHLEIFTSSDGETANNPIVSVHKVSDGKVTLWKDYWDLNAIANTAWFQSSAAKAQDFSWIFDATGLIWYSPRTTRAGIWTDLGFLGSFFVKRVGV
jgi:limonene-1,2-epoxide hydrolase